MTNDEYNTAIANRTGFVAAMTTVAIFVVGVALDNIWIALLVAVPAGLAVCWWGYSFMLNEASDG